MAPHILNLSNKWSFTLQPFSSPTPGKQPNLHWTRNGVGPRATPIALEKSHLPLPQMMTTLPQLSNCSCCSHVCFTQSEYKLKQSYKNRHVLISSTNPLRRYEILGNMGTNKFTASLSPTIISMGKQWHKLSCSRVLESPANIRGVIKKYGECCCRVRSNGKAGIFNMGSGALNLSKTVCDKFQLVQCSQLDASYGWEKVCFKVCCKSWITKNALTQNFVSNCKKVLKKYTKC